MNPRRLILAGLALFVLAVTANARPPQEPEPDLPGRFRKSREAHPEPALTDEQRKQLDELRAIGYVAGSTAAPAESNVVLYSREKAAAGLSFYTSGHAPEAILMDMEGNVLHRWRFEFQRAFPDHPLQEKPDTGFWRRAYLYPNGDVLAIHEGLGILKLDKDSKLIWAHAYPVHHDLEVMPSGEVMVLTREAHVVPRVSEDPILEDFVSILSPDGEEKERISLLECFERSGDEHSWLRASRQFWSKERERRMAFRGSGDVFHTNSLAVLDGRNADRVPEFRAGNVLVSMCHLDMVAVVDLQKRQVVWSLAGRFGLQHDPSLTPGGDLLVFDNYFERERSRVAQVDPATLETRWEYVGSDDRPFYSRTCGTAARLANGNTLITESDYGHAFEVTADKELVWDFYNPHRAGDGDEYIATLFDLVRLDPDFPVGWARGR